MLVRWTEMHVKQTDSEQADLKRLLTGQELPEYTPEFSFAYSPMVFDMADIARFNRSQDEKSTTIRMKDGDTFVVAVGYSDFRELYISATGLNVHSFVEKEGKVQTKKSAKKGTDTDSTKPIKGDDFDIDKI